jgi:hypothetical protein
LPAVGLPSDVLDFTVHLSSRGANRGFFFFRPHDRSGIFGRAGWENFRSAISLVPAHIAVYVTAGATRAHFPRGLLRKAMPD